MILARARKNQTQARATHDLLRDCRNQKWQVPLEASGANAHGGRVRVNVGLTKRCKLSFE